MSVCVIVEMEGFADWSESMGGYVVMPGANRPTALQLSREKADLEAKRLAALHPAGRFVVFEAVALGMRIEVPTHVSIDGKTVISGSVPAVLQLGDPDADIPF